MRWERFTNAASEKARQPASFRLRLHDEEIATKDHVALPGSVIAIGIGVLGSNDQVVDAIIVHIALKTTEVVIESLLSWNVAQAATPSDAA